MGKEYERVKEEATNLVWQHTLQLPEEPQERIEALRRAIIKVLSLVEIKSDNQSLPELNLPTLTGNKSLEITITSFAKKIRNEMLTPDSEGNVWVKVKANKS